MENFRDPAWFNGHYYDLYSQDGTCYPTTLGHNNDAATLVQGNGDYANDISIILDSQDPTPPNSQMKRSKSSAPQRARSRGGVALEGSPGYATQNMPRGYSHWVALPPQAGAVHGHLQQQAAAFHGHLQQQAAAFHGHLQQQRPAGYHPEHQRFRGSTSYSQTAPFQRAAATTPGHGNHQRSTEMQSQWGFFEGPSVIQTTECSQSSSMQNLASRLMRAPAPSTGTSSSGASGGTFSSVPESEQGGFQNGPDASQPSNLPYQMSLLQVTDSAGDFSRNIQAMQSTRSSHGVNGATRVCIHAVTPIICQLTIHHTETMPPLERSELGIAQFKAVTGVQAVTDHFLEHAISSST
ncbi:hypothetical protein L211DRAFT_844836 [Terfezia boudieri ATCC MYA-4762]|uniref:Uncharacterized protein n=1 Tax=Terfezia boudieri ATCC MYA-4762 TaxID=1051890 RepID=A0A3N4M468_9PEZI|nr:hypothetical protein L211DRAFT_844836 [Terfezia boudieri ATCC MYA-4762]